MQRLRIQEIEYKAITLSEEVDGMNRIDSKIYMTVILKRMINFKKRTTTKGIFILYIVESTRKDVDGSMK